MNLGKTVLNKNSFELVDSDPNPYIGWQWRNHKVKYIDVVALNQKATLFGHLATEHQCHSHIYTDSHIRDQYHGQLKMRGHKNLYLPKYSRNTPSR